MADSCGAYVSADDLKAAKESILHIEHVATSKDANGAPALVVTDPIRGVGYTNATLDGLFSDIGFKPVNGSFEDGGTLNNRWEVLLYEADGSFYQWMGSLPKVVPAGSTPASAGGIGPGAWVDQSDLTLRSELAAPNGGELIGYDASIQPAPYNSSATVEGAIDRINAKIVYASIYGVVADGVTDDTDALQALSVAVSAMTDPVVIVEFPKGISLVGRQTQAPNATSGYSFRPSYLSVGNFGWFYINNRAGKTIVNAYGYTIKLNPGMKHGAFDPVTGASYATTYPFYNTNYQASVGHCAAFKLNEDITVNGLKTDGNAANMVWGGGYGDTGWQCIGFGVWAAANKIQTFNDVEAFNAVLDAFYFSTEGSWSPSLTGKQRSVTMNRCIGRDSRRQGITIAGGQNFVFEQCQFYSIGRKATGAGSYYSAPEACMDIETESGAAYDIVANNCQFIDGRYTVVAASFINPAARAKFNGCLLRTNSDVAQVYTTLGGVLFENCIIEGSGLDLRDTTSSLEVGLRRCLIRNHISGTTATFCRWVGNVGIVEDCTFDIVANTGMSSAGIFALTAGDVSATPTYPQKGFFRYCRINITGNQDVITPQANGRINLGTIQFFYDMDVRFTASGATGSVVMDMDTGGSLVSQRGITVDNTKVVDRATGTSIAMPAGGYHFPRTCSFAANAVGPVADNVTALGSSTRTFAELYMGTNGGVRMKSPNGTVYRLTVSNAGALVITAV